MDEDDVIYIYAMEYCSAIKKNKILQFAATQMDDLENIMLSEISQREKGKYCIKSLICGILKKNATNDYICKTETDSQTQKTNYCCC